MKQRRLLFVVNHAGFFVSHRLPIAVAAMRAGFDVHVATPPSRHVPLIQAEKLPWHALALSRSSRNPVREAATAWGMYRIYRELRPHIVHHVTSKPVLYGTPAARAARVPCVVNAISGMGHVFARSVERTGPLQYMVGLAYGAALRHPCMRVIFQNAEHRAAFLSRGWVSEREAVTIAGSGVDTDLFVPPVARTSDSPLVVLASRMLWTKGVREFVAAAVALRASGVSARFALVGEPDPDNLASIPEDQLRAWAASGDVEYWGRRSDMPAVLAQADIACLPSYSEGLPKSLVEAAACGLPVVATQVPGCRAVVREGEDGLLVPPKDVDRLASALRRLIEDRELREQYGSAGRIRAVAEFSIGHVVSAHLALFAALAAQ